MNKKVDAFAVVAGIAMVVLSVVLLVVALFGFWPVAIHGVILLIIGIVILLTLRQQEEVEEIKTERNKGHGGHKE